MKINARTIPDEQNINNKKRPDQTLYLNNFALLASLQFLYLQKKKTVYQNR